MWQLITSILGYLAQQVCAHGGAANYTVGDTWYPGFDPYGAVDEFDRPSMVQRKWADNNPIINPNNVSMACNAPGLAAHSYIPINAGENITAVYYYWVHTVGPMIVWLADCHGDCNTVKPHKLDWFKIAEEGLISGTVPEGEWFQRAFVNWNGGPSLWSEKIPETLKPGKYLVRHEIISLHSEHKPQWYPECAHLEIKGAGTKYPGKEFFAKIPGVYNMSQPEINIDIYSDEYKNKTTYKIPGPPVWTG